MRDSPRSTTAETWRETVESVIIAFVLAFVFRAYVVEAFVIPTGSMAPTLLGRHLEVRCRQCGWSFTADPDDSHLGRGGVLKRTLPAICPMCHFPNQVPAGTPPRGGDRILVEKIAYELTPPRRFDVVVFKNPHKPRDNYIKRVVGLPRESLAILEGNLYRRPAGAAPGQGWEVIRKSERPRVQRALWQPIYDSRYIPLDGGSEHANRYAVRGRELTWRRPWRPDHASHWSFSRYGYAFSGERGRLRFDFAGQWRPYATAYPYNHLKRHDARREPVEDIRLALSAKPEAPGAMEITLETTARLGGDSPERLLARVKGSGELTLETGPLGGSSTRTLARAETPALSPHRPVQLELWYVDQQASLWLDGVRILEHNFDLPLEQLLGRPGPPPHPRLSIHVSGTPLHLGRVQVDRDIYYSSQNARQKRARGGLLKAANARLGQPVTLGPDEFFCLGDNSPMSSDSRYWDSVDPWVQAHLLEGDDASYGIVPRRLIIGRAFFVYWPPMHPTEHLPTRLWVPNFADMRTIR